MAKFAPVCPTRIYEGLKRDSLVAFGDYFLLLAHDVLADTKAYEDLFWYRPKESIVHLDNSVIELGSSVSMHILWNAAEIVQADTIALSDVLCDGIATITSTLNAYEQFIKFPTQSRKRQPMIIPQGKDMDDWINCLETCVSVMGTENIPWVGIPRNIVGRIAASRAYLIGFTKGILPNAKIHLMGFSDNIVDDMYCAKIPRVVGIDSAVPMRCTDVFTITSDPGPRGGWWDTCQYTTRMGVNVLHARDMCK